MAAKQATTPKQKCGCPAIQGLMGVVFLFVIGYLPQGKGGKKG
jgi:hypothetical protein